MANMAAAALPLFVAILANDDKRFRQNGENRKFCKRGKTRYSLSIRGVKEPDTRSPETKSELKKLTPSSGGR